MGKISGSYCGWMTIVVRHWPHLRLHFVEHILIYFSFVPSVTHTSITNVLFSYQEFLYLMFSIVYIYRGQKKMKVIILNFFMIFETCFIPCCEISFGESSINFLEECIFLEECNFFSLWLKCSTDVKWFVWSNIISNCTLYYYIIFLLLFF